MRVCMHCMWLVPSEITLLIAYMHQCTCIAMYIRTYVCVHSVYACVSIWELSIPRMVRLCMPPGL